MLPGQGGHAAPLQPQRGGFYGSWITPERVRPFKHGQGGETWSPS